VTDLELRTPIEVPLDADYEAFQRLAAEWFAHLTAERAVERVER
jgi:hypothetical protein